MTDKDMNYSFYCRDPLLSRSLKERFDGTPNARVFNGDILEARCDAIVSPANSFGFMDGGLDLQLSERFGWSLQDDLRKQIGSLPLGELLVGQALVLPTGDELIPYLISAPTMRVPMNFNIATSLNAYLAMKAILVAAGAHDGIESVAIPGLCTGIGRMPQRIAANQMFSAFSEIALGNRSEFSDFGEAQKHQWKLNEDGMIYN